MTEVLLRLEGITKTFPGVQALSDCRFDLQAGEVHALVGENGAGKSTLMKVVSGIYQKDSGHIYYMGNEVEIPNPRAAQHLGISIIHQELNLMPHLTVAQNVFIGREPRSKFPFGLDEKLANQQTERVLNMLNLQLAPTMKVSDLTVAKQQMVEIAKALSFNAKILIMDEPTAALTETEIEELFRIIKQLREKGVGIVHISHRLEELKQISDRVTVMRDGKYIDTLQTKDATIDQIISLMVGRTIFETAPELPEVPSQEVVLEVRNLNRGKVLRDVNFSLMKGEILGFAGLVGAGRTEVARAIFGADGYDSGEIYIKGQPVHIKSPGDAVTCGVGYLSEDRKRYGLALGMDVKENVVLSAMKRFLNRFGWVDFKKTRVRGQEVIKALNIKTPSLEQKVKFLSGGNQQKVVIGKWLTADTDILIFDEPTRGIDVGAKSEIYKLLNDLAQQGKSIIMISSELPEILRMSHRVVVMCEGRVTGILNASEATQESIMKYATMRSEAVLMSA
ncbi:MAG TPA: sugar ABC transporter ATP-binding protein [Anaerolineales bacterium]|nr:sugar ABC transporter ATP-binding protein [Anaerolineales bacterium]HLO31749.1 sugar ABC transporter ATP-binding protein [Anaerolineales bacterium]